MKMSVSHMVPNFMLSLTVDIDNCQCDIDAQTNDMKFHLQKYHSMWVVVLMLFVLHCYHPFTK